MLLLCTFATIEQTCCTVAAEFTEVLKTETSQLPARQMVEELLDRLQRETLADENVQPTIRMINKIHVLEEVRHISFARAKVSRMVPKIGHIPLAANRLALAFAAPFLVRLSLHIRWMGERITKILIEAGMIEGALTKALWRRSFLLGKPTNGARQ